MEQVWLTAALWLILALVATLLSIWFRISTALSEIVVGTVTQHRIGALIGTEALGEKSAWISFLAAKMLSKIIPLVPTVRAFNYLGHEGMYYSLMMSTGLTFGTISALFGLNHQIIDQTQYSHLVATVIGSAVIPTAIANAYFMPKHLLPSPGAERGSENLTPAREEAH